MRWLSGNSLEKEIAKLTDWVEKYAVEENKDEKGTSREEGYASIRDIIRGGYVAQD